MAIQLLRVLIAVVILAILIPTFLLLVNRRALFQPIGTAVIRNDGNRLLGPPQEAKPLAQDELPYALLSEAAYQKASVVAAGQSPKPSPSELALQDSGWCPWPAFFASDVEERFKKHHLRVEVWENDQLASSPSLLAGQTPKALRTG